MSSAGTRSTITTPLLHVNRPGVRSPVVLFEALYSNQPHSFLYESLALRGEHGRYSFMGGRPRQVFRARGECIELTADGRTETRTTNVLDGLRAVLNAMPDPPDVVPFAGGVVGYFAFDMVRQFERLPVRAIDEWAAPDAYFLVPDEIVIFDHLDNTTNIILYGDSAKCSRLAEIQSAFDLCSEDDGDDRDFSLVEIDEPPILKSNMTPEQFKAAVTRVREYILAGDIFQAVISQRFEAPFLGNPLRLYRALRRTNPSPYMYYLSMDDHHLLGSSPEVLVKLVGRTATSRPLAGTRPRGRTPEEDDALSEELLADPKEAAEHVMLVDLARNDLGRVCDYGTICVNRFREIERYPRVMHIVSSVEGKIREGLDALDLFRAAFPAGTVSGAPKCRAMEIIEELEPTRRGNYAGAFGYIDARGDMDLCIAIRTIIVRSGRAFAQAGAGVVADSQPGREYAETVNKARALFHALQLAGAGS